MANPILTTSQVNKAGKMLRHLLAGRTEATNHELDWALSVLLAFRAAHQGPMTGATISLRWRVDREGCKVEVSQRLKRVPTILDKILREPTMQLANMQDIGGCRAVVDTIDEVRRIQKRIRQGKPRVVREYDYITAPRESGYRGIHMILEYKGRKIEVQLRTNAMHEWAIYVERLGGRLQADLKSGRGPQSVLDWLEAVSAALAVEESGSTVDTALVERIGALRAGALPYLEGGRR